PPSALLQVPQPGRMLPRTYRPPSQPATGNRSTVIVSKSTSTPHSNEHGAVTPLPKLSSSHCFRLRRARALPRALVFVVPRFVGVVMAGAYQELSKIRKGHTSPPKRCRQNGRGRGS